MRKETIKRVVPMEVKNEIARLQEVEKNQETARREIVKRNPIFNKSMADMSVLRAPKIKCKVIKRKVLKRNQKNIDNFEKLPNIHTIDDTVLANMIEHRERMQAFYTTNETMEIINDITNGLELVYTSGIAQSMYKSILKSMAFPKKLSKTGKAVKGNVLAQNLVYTCFTDSICEDLEHVVLESIAENWRTETFYKNGKHKGWLQNIQLHKIAVIENIESDPVVSTIKGKKVFLGYNEKTVNQYRYKLVYLDGEEIDDSNIIVSQSAKNILSSVRKYMYRNGEGDMVNGRLYVDEYSDCGLPTMVLEKEDNAKKTIDSELYISLEKMIVNERDRDVLMYLINGVSMHTIAKNSKLGMKAVRLSVERIKTIIATQYSDILDNYSPSQRAVLSNKIEQLQAPKETMRVSKYNRPVIALKDKTAQPKNYVYHDYKRINGGAIVGIGYDMPIQWVEKKEVPKMVEYSNGYLSALQNEMAMHNGFINAIDTDTINSNRTAIMGCISALTTALSEM